MVLYIQPAERTYMCLQHQWRSCMTLVPALETKQNSLPLCSSLVPRPFPDFISQLWRKNDFSLQQWDKIGIPPQLQDTIWEWPGNEASTRQPPVSPPIHLVPMFISSWGKMPYRHIHPVLWMCLGIASLPPPWPAWVKPLWWKFPSVPGHPILPGSQGYAWWEW